MGTPSLAKFGPIGKRIGRGPTKGQNRRIFAVFGRRFALCYQAVVCLSNLVMIGEGWSILRFFASQAESIHPLSSPLL